MHRLSSTRAALATGFAIVFALWLLWGYQLGRSLQNIERSVASVHEQYVRGEQTLSKVRTNVLLGSIYLRDALIDTAVAHRDDYRAELGRLRETIEQSLTAYVPEVGSEVEREHWARLQTELAEFWASRELALTDSEPRSPAQAAALLRTRVVPRRETILQVLDQLAALQAEANRRRQEEANALYSQVRFRLMSMGGATLLAALVVAVMASRHVSRLQREIERQRAAEQQNRQDLERLSARLVDVQEAERRTLARELHDEVGQALTAVKMDIGIALRSDNGLRVKGALEEASELTETTLRGVRDLSQLLHPSMLDDFGLPTTLTTYLRSFSQRTGIRAQLAETIDDRLVPPIEVGVYRIVQEAFNNIVQHSGATACTVSLSGGGGALRLVIEDNGRGLGPFPRAVATRQGLGLIGMRERAQALGGSFLIENAVTGGTRISVTLPLRVAAPDTTDEPERQAV
ncbi:MAG TPA: ATP-binding protein [Vicinamibacterales bacterium]|jgi:signal transduction histidine kinase|nr:ATP-binding protein [Vicinamibacterales bacterium]